MLPGAEAGLWSRDSLAPCQRGPGNISVPAPWWGCHCLGTRLQPDVLAAIADGAAKDVCEPGRTQARKAEARTRARRVDNAWPSQRPCQCSHTGVGDGAGVGGSRGSLQR